MLFYQHKQISQLVDELSEDQLKPIIKASLLNPLKYFCPNGAQNDFIKTVAHSTEKSRVPVILSTFANGVGKCLRLDSPVLMADGEWKSLGDIKAGDMVLGHNYITGGAKPSKVLATSKAGIKDVYRFSFKDGGYVDASAEHHFPVKLRSGRNSKVVKKKVQDLLNYKVNYTGGSIKFQQAKTIDFKKSEKDLLIHPYLMGVILADGGISAGSINITTKDLEILNKIKSVLNKGYQLKAKSSDNSGKATTYSLIKSSENQSSKNSYNEFLKEVGLWGKTSHNKFIPHEYKTASIEERKQLIAGMIDADGSIKEYVSVNEQLSDDFVFVARSLGGTAIKHKRKQITNFSKGKKVLSYRIYWNFDYNIPLALSRKQKVSKRPVEYSNRFVTDIKHIGKYECGDIFIDHPQHCYISHDFISTGNTTISIHVMLNIIYGVQNAWFDYPLFRNYPFPKTFWYSSTVEAIKETIVPMIESFAKPGTYKVIKEGKAYISKIIFNYEGKTWTLSFKTFDQDVKQFESATIGLNIVDEPMPEELWKAVKSRRRLGCISLLPMTPLYCPPYVLDEIQARADSGVGGYYHLKADVYSACKERGVRGHLEPDIIDRMVDEYDEEERQARAFGEFMYFSGSIFPELNREAHFVSPKDFPIPIYSQIFEVKDPHDGRPSAIIWGAKTPQGRTIIFDELPEKQDMAYWKMTTPIDAKDEIRQIWEKESNMPYTVQRRVLDRRFGWQTRAGTTLAKLYMQAGDELAREYPNRFGGKRQIYVSSYTPPAGTVGEISYGHSQVRSALKMAMDDKPNLVIWDNCYHTWNGLTHYIRQKKTGKSAEQFATGDGKIVEKFKDFPDAVRYLICAGQSKDIQKNKTQTQHQKDAEFIRNMGKRKSVYTHS